VVKFAHLPRDRTVPDSSAESVRNPAIHCTDDASAMGNLPKSVSSMAMNRNGCNPIGTAEHGLSSSAMPSTGPGCRGREGHGQSSCLFWAADEHSLTLLAVMCLLTSAEARHEAGAATQQGDILEAAILPGWHTGGWGTPRGSA
jgi:hypothetical protein